MADEIDLPSRSNPSDPDAQPSFESMQRRLGVTLAVRLSQMALNLVSASILPRTLGPRAYGNYNFLITAASTARGLTEPSVQQAVYTFSSEEKRTGSLTRVYAAWLALQLTLLLAFVGIALATGFADVLWPHQPGTAIVAVTIVDWLMFGALSLQQFGDSKGLTVWPQLVGGIASFINAALLLGLVALGHLTFWTYLALNLVYGGILCLALVVWLFGRHRDLVWTKNAERPARAYLRRWWTFARPLIIVEYYTPLIAFLGVYLVQAWYGSVEQAYLALGMRWSTLALVFASSGLSIFWRELAFANASGNLERAAHVYSRFGRLLVCAAIVVSWWLAVEAPVVIRVLAGQRYAPASSVLAVMAFYPVQQTYGQLSITGMKALGRTREFRNIALATSVPELMLTYFLLAPRTAVIPGLHLGAMGVALRMVIFGLISVQIYEWANARFFKIDYWRELIARLRMVALTGAVAGLTLVGVHRVFARLGDVPAAAIASMFYIAVVMAMVWIRPDLLGLSRSEILSRLRGLVQGVIAR